MSFRSNIINLLYKIVYVIELTWLLIDSIGGYFLIQGNGSSIVNSIIRGIVLIIIVSLFLIDSRIKYRELPLFVLLLIFIITSIQYFIFNYNEFDFSIIFRLLILPLLIVLIRAQMELRRLTFEGIRKIVTVNSLILVGNIILSFFKIGANNYGVNKSGEYVGGTGFFYAGNEVGGVILVLCGLGLFFYLRKGTFLLLLFCALYLIAALGLLSKTALISVVINIGTAILITYGIRTILVIIPVIGVIILFLDKIMIQISLFWNRISYFADLYGWGTVLLGGSKRSTQLDYFLSLLLQKPFIIFVGHGWSGVLENNFFDVLEAFGLFGYIFFLIPIVFFIKAVRRNNKIQYFKGYQLIYLNSLLILFVSVLAGHIVQSAMLAPFIAILINIGLLIKNKSFKTI